MARMIAIGPERFTLVFGALGFEPAVVEQSAFFAELRERVSDPSVGLVVCGESYLEDVSMDEVKALCAASPATVLVVPDGPKPKGLAYELLRGSIERAAGVDLLSAVEPGEPGPGEQ